MTLSCPMLAICALSLAACSAASLELVVPTPTETTIWDGVYTDEQARRGQRLYERECAECHLDDLMGDGVAPALIGRSFFFRWGDLSIADMVVAIRTTMPEGAPASLSAAGYVDISAYLLAKSAVPSGGTELPIDMDDLVDIIVTEGAQ